MNKNSHNSENHYYQLTPEEIAKDINTIFSVAEPKMINIMGTDFIVCPHVYPSHKFRSTFAMLDVILNYTQNKKVCEIGCGCGTLGQLALKKGALKLVQGDINPYAVENALSNKNLHAFNDEQLEIYESDCFDKIPPEVFDVIIFAMPYHNDNIKIVDPLLRAFYDPNFSSIRKFLLQATKFSGPKTKIFIAFSNKGNTADLENIFSSSQFSWELFKVTNKEAEYDNRVYKLSLH